jgi:hypothetical protein
MIHYQLICDADHAFDGWFRDSATFDKQAKAGLVACPECGVSKVHRALMAPSIGRRAAAPAMDNVVTTEPVPTTPAVPVPVAGGVLPDQVRAMLQRLRAEVEKNCEHVGNRFAEEARAIHNGESEARPIYGETTPDQAEALAEDGIEIARIPWIPRADG